MAIVRALGKRKSGMTRGNIIDATGTGSGRNITECLSELVQCGFLKLYHSVEKAKSGGIYQLVDPYCLFYFEFIEGWRGDDSRHWSRNYNSPRVNSWRGRAFERVCFCHVPQIKARLGISGIEANAYSWRGKTVDEGLAQIDMLIDRADGVIDICEIKYSEVPYELSKEEDAKIVRRLDSFRRASRTRKSICSVLQSNWYYGAAFDADVNGKRPPDVEAYEWLDKAGFDQIPTGSNFSCETNFADTVKFCDAHCNQDRLKGYMMAPWTRTFAIHEEKSMQAISQMAEAIKARKA